MIELSPRRLAFVGLLAALAGAVVDVVLVLANGAGLAGGYVAGLLGGYLFYGSVGLIAVGACIAAVAHDRSVTRVERGAWRRLGAP